MKIRLQGKDRDASISALKLIRVERETGKSLSANAADPSITFICSIIAAATTTEANLVTTAEVADALDLGEMGYYSQIVATLLDDAISCINVGGGNVQQIKKRRGR